LRVQNGKFGAIDAQILAHFGEAMKPQVLSIEPESMLVILNAMVRDNQPWLVSDNLPSTG
jgi:hypothetical protein